MFWTILPYALAAIGGGVVVGIVANRRPTWFSSAVAFVNTVDNTVNSGVAKVAAKAATPAAPVAKPPATS